MTRTAGKRQRMLHSDAFAWYMEKDPVLRSTVVAITRLDSRPDWDRLYARIRRLTVLVPTLRMRVQVPPLRIGPPQWTVDDGFDLDYHLRRARVREGGGWGDVLEFARTAAMSDFDRARPLWEFTLLEGLADGGAAFVTKLHHSLTDGIGGIQLAALVVDPGPAEPPLGPAPAEPIGHPLSTVGLAVRSVTDDVAESAVTTGHVVRRIPGLVTYAVRDPVGAMLDAIDAARSVVRMIAPVNHAASDLLGRRHVVRRLATLDIPLADLHAAAEAAGGHLNDAYLAILTGAMHRYHERRGAELRQLRVTVPVSVRTAADSVGGNRITLIRITLPAHISEPGERIGRIAQIMSKWRREPALGHTQEIAFGLNLLPRAYLGSVFKRIELLASDVPGIPRPVWLAGAQITGYYAFGPTIGSSVNATLMSYAGTCNIGVNIDVDAVDDPDSMLECIREEIDEILGLSRDAATAMATARRKR